MKKDYTTLALIKRVFAVHCLLFISSIQSIQIKDFFIFYFFNRKNKWFHLVSSIICFLSLSILSNSTITQVSRITLKNFSTNGTKQNTLTSDESYYASTLVANITTKISENWYFDNKNTPYDLALLGTQLSI